MIAIKDAVLTPQVVTPGQSFTISVQVFEVGWDTIMQDFASWQDIKTNLASWASVKNHTGEE